MMAGKLAKVIIFIMPSISSLVKAIANADLEGRKHVHCSETGGPCGDGTVPRRDPETGKCVCVTDAKCDHFKKLPALIEKLNAAN